MSTPLSGPAPAPLTLAPVSATTAVPSAIGAGPPNAVEFATLALSVLLVILAALAMHRARRSWRTIARTAAGAKSAAQEAIRSADRAERTAAEAHRSIIEIGAALKDPPPGMLEVRDSVHLGARRSTLTRRSTRVLFLVHLIGVWDSCHTLVEAMDASADFEPIVASIPRRFRGSEEFVGENEVHRGLTERGVPHLRFAGDAPDTLRLIKAIDPDVIFRQSQWDDDVPAELGTERLSFARTCLVPYETMNIVVNVPDGRQSNTAVDSEYHRTAWLVFCANETMREMAIRDGGRDGAQFRVVGHPKADHLRSVAPAWPIPPAGSDPVTYPGDDSGDDSGGSEGGGSRPGRVVWSAHHSIARGWTDFGAFHLMCDEMLAWARQSVGTEFVFMPHPALLPFPDSDLSPIGREEFDAWMAAWAGLSNTAVLSEADYGPTLAASDVMVTDGLSMLIEYQLFDKPLIFFEREGHRPFNSIGEEVLGGVHTVDSVDEARERIEGFLSGEPDPLRNRQRDITRRLLGAGDIAARILEVLRREIALERG